MRHILVLLTIVIGFTTPIVTVADAIPQYYINHSLPVPGSRPYDDMGIRMHDYGGETGWQYNPLFVINDAIDYYNDFHEVPDGFLPNNEYKRAFFQIIDWLQNYQISNSEQTLIPYYFRSDRGVDSPWFSAITQARAAKLYALAYHWTEEDKYLELANSVIVPLFNPVESNGFLYVEGELIFFEEYPKPQPDHVLNGHMSVILDLHEVNKVLQDPLIHDMTNQAIDSLIQLLPVFYVPEEVSFALMLEPGSRFEEQRTIANTIVSYDLIHLKYLSQLFQITGRQEFKDYFYKYYASIGLNEIYNNGINAISPMNGATIEEDSGFRNAPHNLVSAFHNYKKNPSVYASGVVKEKSHFIVDLSKSKSIDHISLRFHWGEYPRSFRIEGWQGNKWIELVQEVGWEPVTPAPIYEKKIMFAEPVSKIKFTAWDYSNQQRLLLDYFFAIEKPTPEVVARIWKDSIGQGILAIGDSNHILNLLDSMSDVQRIDLINGRLIDYFAEVISVEMGDVEELFQQVLQRYNRGGFLFSLDIFEAEIQSEEVSAPVDVDSASFIRDGYRDKFKTEPYIESNSVMVPLREILETLEYEVRWNGVDKVIRFTIGDNAYYVYPDRPHYFINNTEIAWRSKEAIKIKDGITMVSLEQLASWLNYSVFYNKNNNTVNLISNSP